VHNIMIGPGGAQQRPALRGRGGGEGAPFHLGSLRKGGPSWKHAKQSKAALFVSYRFSFYFGSYYLFSLTCA
jgi:hypothetical protein